MRSSDPTINSQVHGYGYVVCLLEFGEFGKGSWRLLIRYSMLEFFPDLDKETNLRDCFDESVGDVAHAAEIRSPLPSTREEPLKRAWVDVSRQLPQTEIVIRKHGYVSTGKRGVSDFSLTSRRKHIFGIALLSL